MRNYIVTGCAIVDRVLPQGKETQVRVSPGGGGVYALTGIKLWHEDCKFVCYSGKDFDSYYGQWMAANGLSSDGVVPRFEKTNVCDLYYRPDGTHTMGAGNPDYLGKPADSPDMALLQPHLTGSMKDLALHLVTGYVGDLFEQLQPYRRDGLLIGYEIDPEDNNFPDIRADMPQICARYIDFFSISFAELKEIFPTMKTIEQAIEYCRALGCAVFLRAGETGAYMIQEGTVVHTPMISAFGNEDPTGCGNSSTAAAFYAFCENRSPKEASVLGGVTASLNAGYRGLIREITPEIQKQCAELVQDYLSR